MPTTRNKLFRAAAVFAIAMVVGAWTASTRGGEDTFEIGLFMNGAEVNLPDSEPSADCLFHVNEWGTGEAPFSLEWWGDVFTKSGGSLWEFQTLPSSPGTYYQYVAVQDANLDSDNDFIVVPVSSSGGGCAAG
jgi:hypothetical protein